MIIKNVDEIESGFTQAFKYTPLSFGSYSSNKILDLCEKGVIDKSVTAIAQYLYKYKCAPLEYILRDIKGLDERIVTRKMEGLVRNRIFNAFMLVDNNEQFDNSEGMIFYTLDYGAVLLLRNLIEDENLDNWKATDLYMSGIKVKKALMVIDFCNSLGETDFYNTYIMYASYGAKLRTKAVFKQDGKIYLVEMVCQDDTLDGATTDMTEKILHYSQLLSTEGWSYYFEERPILLIVADTDKAKETFKKRLEGCDIPEIKYTTLTIKPV